MPVRPEIPQVLQRKPIKSDPGSMALVAVGFVIGILVGIAVLPPVHANPYPSLPAVAEPEAGKRLAAALVSDDPRRLASAASPQVLQALGQAIQPVAVVFEMRFLGAVERNGEVLAGYAIEGRDRKGQDVPVGFVLRIVKDEVVGVN